jgi:predicted RNA-binding Zn ribbon-like protein
MKAAEHKSLREFDISGGNVALDFANTVSQRLSKQKQEYLLSYADLIRWAKQAGVISSTEADRISCRAVTHPRQAATVLQTALELRESVQGIFSAIAAHQEPPREHLRALSVALQRLHRKVELTWTWKGAVWEWNDEPDSLQKILWPVLHAGAGLLTSRERKRVRECEADNCAWLFMDHSKNQSRRWCDMKVCGNREKARRFYRRNR